MENGETEKKADAAVIRVYFNVVIKTRSSYFQNRKIAASISLYLRC